MASIEDQLLAQAIAMSEASLLEEEQFEDTLKMSREAHEKSARDSGKQTATEIVKNPVTSPVQLASDDAIYNVARLEEAIRNGKTSRYIGRDEQTQNFLLQHGDKMQSVFTQAEEGYGFPPLSISNFKTGPADGACQQHAIQEGLEPTHFLHKADADNTTMAEIKTLRDELCGHFCKIPEDLRVVIYPLDPNETEDSMQEWAKQPLDTKLWTYSEFIHLTLLLEYAGVSCAVYDLHATSWSFLNTTAERRYSVVLVKTEGHYGSIAIDTMEDRQKVHNAMQSRCALPW